MIQTEQRNALVLEDNECEAKSIKMSIDWESEEFLMQTLSKNFYSDGIGSTCRELASNALDSHRRANVTDIPIIVSFKKENNGNYEFSVEDAGIGLDYNDVINIISKYGKSTARGVKDLLGMMGYGFKAPMSYTSSFIFIIRKDGVERKCMMYDGEEGMKIDLLDENSTDRANGVKVIVPVSYSDVRDFYDKIKEQLCYFESIYFDVNCNYGSIDNNFKITRYDDFQMSELSDDDNLHICLDNVYYPLDFKKLDIPSISCPVGLRFSLSDGIFPTPNREAVRMTPEAKAIIIKKIKTVASKMVEMYNKSVEDADDFRKIVKHYSEEGKYLDIGHKQNVEINDIMSYSNVKVKNPHLKGVSLLDLKKLVEERDEIFSEYTIKYEMSYNSRLKERKYNDFMGFWQLEDKNTVYKFSEKLGGVKKEYIKSISPRNTFLVKKIRDRKLFSDKTTTNGYIEKGTVSYHTLLNLHQHPKSEWRTRIKEFQSIKESFEKNIKDLDKLEIPKTWLDNRKAQRVTIRAKKNGHQKLEGEISCKRAEPLERYVDGKDCKFTPFSLNLKKIQQTNMFYIYGAHDDNIKLDKLYNPLRKHKCMLITFSERELKRINELDVHNLISYDNFMKGNTKLFKRLVTSYLINELETNNRSIFNKFSEVANVSTYLSEKIGKIRKYSRDNYESGAGTLYKAMLEVAQEHSLFDYSVYNDYLEVKETLDKFPFLETIYDTMRSNEATRDMVVTDLLKYNKYKVNLDKYAKKEETVIN